MAGAETLLALSLNLVRDGRIGMNRLFALLTANPAKILGIEAGDFATGSAADIIFIDPDTPWQVDSDKMAASAGNTPFDRMPVQGRVRSIMKGGQFRSEEHTSDLQSNAHLVCRPLLEKTTPSHPAKL